MAIGDSDPAEDRAGDDVGALTSGCSSTSAAVRPLLGQVAPEVGRAAGATCALPPAA